MYVGETPLYGVLNGIGRPVAGHRPWPRYHTNRDGWRFMLEEMAGSGWSLVGLWGEAPGPGPAPGGGRVYVCLREDFSGDVAVVSLDCPGGTYPAVSRVRHGAIRLERALRDLHGLVAEGAEDTRPWLDFGTWDMRTPLAAQPLPVEHADPGGVVRVPEPGRFLPVDGEGLHRIPVGPVHAGIIEPGHFRFTANGETVVRLEERLGWVHKGIEKLMRGRGAEDGARLIARVSGDSTVAHSLAFARAVEAALEVEVPLRAVWLRALMAELERLANHFGDIGAICNDAAFAFMQAGMSRLREAVLRCADACFGHRLMMDCVVPGGTSVDIAMGGVQQVLDLVGELRRRFPPLVRIYEGKASLQDRMVGTGLVSSGLVNRFGAGGYVGRAAGRGQDARRSPSYPPYDDLEFNVVVRTGGDVNARVWIRIDEVEESLSLVEQIIRQLPGPLQSPGSRRPLPWVPLSTGTGEGMALVESFRGEIMTWVRMGEFGKVERCYPRDPSWFQWPLLEAAIEGNIVADFPLCNKSFNCSYSGHDL
jgi:Ni,Fe-hydrogenase III large subunit